MRKEGGTRANGGGTEVSGEGMGGGEKRSGDIGMIREWEVGHGLEERKGGGTGA